MPLKRAIDDLAAAWISGDGAAGEGEGARSSADVEGWKTAQFLGFLNLLDAKRDSLSADLLRRMDALYNFSSTGNAEIRFRWQKLRLRWRRRLSPRLLSPAAWVASRVGREVCVAAMRCALRP